MSERRSDKNKVYMKSIEQVIPYNQMARHNIELEKYLELNPATKGEGLII